MFTLRREELKLTALTQTDKVLTNHKLLRHHLKLHKHRGVAAAANRTCLWSCNKKKRKGKEGKGKGKRRGKKGGKNRKAFISQ